MEDMMDTPVKIYSLSTCGHCKAAKRFLDDQGIQYEATDVDLLDTLEKATVIKEVKDLNPRISFPTIIIGNRVIIGFKEQELREAIEQ
jgi:glutaredoxin